MTRNTFKQLCENLRPYLQKKDTNYRKAITLGKRVAIPLFILKSGVDNSIISDLFGVGQSTVSYLLNEFCDAMNIEHKNLIKFPNTEEEKAEIAKEFYNKWQYYNCFGAIDGTHIPVLPPNKNAIDYYCYKCFHSINVLAMCDDKYIFRYFYYNFQ